MTISAFDGPIIGFPNNPAQTPSGSTGSANQNPESGPMMSHHGHAVLDARFPYTYKPGQGFGSITCGWFATDVIAIDQTPTATQTNNIATAQTATAGAALTLVSSNTTGITVGQTVTDATTGKAVASLLAIDSAMTTIPFGQAGTIQMWSPQTSVARAVKISSNGADQAATATVRGYDMYWYPMSETITLTTGSVSTVTVATGKKAFKYIKSITINGTANSTGLTVGTSDVIGLPLRADTYGYLGITYGNAPALASTGFTAAVTTTATATSGDVRGTYQLQTASNGTSSLQIWIGINPANATSFVNIIGQPQFSN